MRKIFYAVIILGIVLIVGYGAIVVYGNVVVFNEDPYSVPDADKARYSIKIKNTGLTLFSDGAERQGKIVSLNTYWDLDGKKYRFKDRPLILDEKIFGPIILRDRR